jgi:hypothetical protein
MLGSLTYAAPYHFKEDKMAEQLIASGSFTSDGAAHNIALRSDFNVFRVWNRTQSATTQTTGRGCKFEWQRGQADGEAFMFTKQNSVNALDLELITTGGFTRVDQSSQVLGAAQATSGTDVTQADPAVVTVTAHGYSNGDRVRIYGTTGMLEIAGYDFTIAAVAANNFTLAYLDSSGFASVATAGFVRKVPNNPIYSPQANRITAATAANPMVVTLAVDHGMAVGEKIRLKVSADYGMIEANDLIGEVTAVSTANNTVTLDIDASGFTTFAFPISAVAAAGVTPAHIVPVGDASSTLAGAMDNTAQIVMELGAGPDGPAGSTSDVIYWEALASGYTLAE